MDEMKILYAGDLLIEPPGGAELSMSRLLHELSHDHEVLVVTPQRGAFPGERGKAVRVHSVDLPLHVSVLRSAVRDLAANHHWQRIVEKTIIRSRPDVLITQRSLSPASVKAAREQGIPSIVFVRDLTPVCPACPTFGMRECQGRCQQHMPVHLKPFYHFFRKMRARYHAMLSAADLVVANSRFIADAIHSCTGRRAKVVYPFIDEPEQGNGLGDRVGFLRPEKTKGVDVFLSVARQYSQQYLVAGPATRSVKKELDKLPHVEYHPWIADIDEFYRQCRVLLVPSLWPEPFGRVAAEAMARGIPCIVSDRGALPEVVGDAGIIIHNREDTKAWSEAISSVLEDDELRANLQKKSRKRARQFRFSTTFADFKNTVREELGLNI